MALALNEIEIVRRWASANDRIDRVWMFGSRARGTHRPDSDLDLAATIRPHDDETHHGAASALRDVWEAELQALLPYRVHFHDTLPDAGEEIVWPSVLREGVLLYP